MMACAADANLVRLFPHTHTCLSQVPHSAICSLRAQAESAIRDIVARGGSDNYYCIIWNARRKSTPVITTKALIQLVSVGKQYISRLKLLAAKVTRSPSPA